MAADVPVEIVASTSSVGITSGKAFLKFVDALDLEAAMEGNDSAQPSRLQAIVAEVCAFLNALVSEETGAISVATFGDLERNVTIERADQRINQHFGVSRRIGRK